MFVRRGDYCFREERNGQSEKRRGTERESEKGKRKGGKTEKRGKRDSSIITSFHLDVLDVGMIEEPPTMKSFDGFFRPTNSQPQKSDLDYMHTSDR